MMFERYELQKLVLDYLVFESKYGKKTFKTPKALESLCDKGYQWALQLKKYVSTDSIFSFKKSMYDFLYGEHIDLRCICGKPITKIIDNKFAKTCGNSSCRSRYKNVQETLLSFNELIGQKQEELQDKTFRKQSLKRLVKEYIFHDFSEALEVKSTNVITLKQVFNKKTSWVTQLKFEMQDIICKHPSISDLECLYLWYYDKQRPKCPVCKKNYLKFRSFNKGYSVTCSTSCAGTYVMQKYINV